MPSVSVDDVRDVINLSSAEVSDAKVLKMVKRAEGTLGLEIGKEIDYSSCTDAEKEFITVLVANPHLLSLSGSAVRSPSLGVEPIIRLKRSNSKTSIKQKCESAVYARVV